MKTINVSFEDGDFERLNKVRAGRTWREFISLAVPLLLKGKSDELGRLPEGLH